MVHVMMLRAYTTFSFFNEPNLSENSSRLFFKHITAKFLNVLVFFCLILSFGADSINALINALTSFDCANRSNNLLRPNRIELKA